MADMPKFMPDEQAPAPQGAQGPGGAATPPAQKFAVVGSKDDEIKRQEMIDPSEVEEVTEEEQAQYNDFVSRMIAMISDSRVPEGLDDAKSPSDAVIEVMSNSSFSIPQALSEGAASSIMILHDAAKRAEKPFSPDVMFHGADEVIAALYMLGAAAGIFEGASDYAKGSGIKAPEPAPVEELPAQEPGAPRVDGPASGAMTPPDPAAANPPPTATGEVPTGELPISTESVDEAEGDFTDEEYALLGEALMLTVELFGRKLLESGQLTEEERKEASAFWQQQISKEVETGQVDDAMFDDMDLDSIRNQIMKKGMQ